MSDRVTVSFGIKKSSKKGHLLKNEAPSMSSNSRSHDHKFVRVTDCAMLSSIETRTFIGIYFKYELFVLPDWARNCNLRTTA